MKFIDRIRNKFFRLLPTFWVKVRLQNKQLKLRPFTYNHFYAHDYNQESWMQFLLSRVDAEGQITFFDVGCNIGQTMLKVYDTFEKVRFYGFDANKYCVSFCQVVIEDNKLGTSFQVIHCALGYKDGLIEIPSPQNLDKFNSSLSIIKGFRDDAPLGNAVVPCFKLDSIFDDLNAEKVDVIKIDVEGAELDVLIGMSNLLWRFKPIIILEVLPVYNVENEIRLSRQKKIEEILFKLDYKIYRISKGKRLKLKNINEFGVHSNLGMCDYICLHSESDFSAFNDLIS